MKNIDVGEASSKDIPIILGLLYEFGRSKSQKDSDAESFRKLVKKYITDSDKKIILAQFDDTEIIVMVNIIFLSRLNRNSLELYIPELIVREKFQNQGLGKTLINSCVSIAKEKNVIELGSNLVINERNPTNSIKN
ncbi:MAG: GNAT family N-acetyltransferase [Nitrosopumilus sp.]|nr:GNAT family N-acetyltransferase [Nitrosopumilus sp.]MDH3487521.1 GNAT family N-acetyltransferase [Nitrosopumilus sp.]